MMTMQKQASSMQNCGQDQNLGSSDDEKFEELQQQVMDVKPLELHFKTLGLCKTVG